jgi:hypothetical protein
MSRKSCLKWCTLAVVVISMGAVAAVAGSLDQPLKWSQPPVVLPIIPSPDLPLFLGWDQVSMVPEIVVADDFPCKDPRPVTDLHWWGSYPQLAPGTTPRRPDSFLIRFWTDVPAGADPNMPWSHPGEERWRIVCENYTWEPVGYDIDVEQYLRNNEVVIVDQAYQYNQTLKPEEYFYQDPGENIYWISIQAQYVNPTAADVWGWKTRPHMFNDDAVTGIDVGVGPADIGWQEIRTSDGQSWDMAFELTTVPEPSTFVLLAMGAFGLVAYAWRKRRGA